MPIVAPQNGVDPTWELLRSAIYWADANSPRSLQDYMGPSEIGAECMRQLGYKSVGTETVNLHADHWFAILGTAFHQWVAGAIERWQQEVLGRVRFLIEQRVAIIGEDYGTNGNTDVFDLDLGDVIDWKLVGTSSLRKYRLHGASPQYRVQAHMYGKGWKQRGYEVRNVKNIYVPRSGYLSEAHVWSEPFDESIADGALARMAAIERLAKVVPPETLPTADGCTWCDFYRPHQKTDARGCSGVDS